MGVLNWLFGAGRRRRRPSKAIVRGPGLYELPVVGESQYQDNLNYICGGKREEGVNHLCWAYLFLENTNPHDADAVRVEIEGMTVGYLSRENARDFRRQWKRRGLSGTSTRCAARIGGGWDRGDGDTGHFGVYLDFPME